MLRALALLSRGHLAERPVRTAMTIVGVALGVSVSVAMRTANLDVLRSFEEAVLTVAGRATLEVSGGELGLDELVIADLLAHPDVLSAAPILEVGAVVATGPHRGKALRVMGLDLLEAADLQALRIRVGDEPRASLDQLLSRTALFLGQRLAAEWNLAEGSPLELLVGTRVYRVVVAGVIDSNAGVSSVWDTLAVMDIAAAQALFGAVGRLDRIDIVSDPARPVDEVAQELTRALPPWLTVRRPAHRNAQVERMVRAFQLNLTTLSAVGLLVGLLLVYNTVSYAVVQRRREIGMCRALGMSRGGLAALFMGEATFMGLIGGVVGSAFGFVLANSLVSLLGRTVSDLYVTVPMAAVGIGDLPLRIALEGVGLGVAVSIMGGLAPSLAASRTAPARALAPGEYEVIQTVRAGPLAWVGCAGLGLAGALALPGPVGGIPLFGYASALCLLLSLACLAPLMVRGAGPMVRVAWRADKRPGGVGALSRIAADQVARAPGRNAVTISALLVGVAIMVGVGIMIQSFRLTVEEWINQTIMADLVITPRSWPVGDQRGTLANRIPLSWADAVAAIPGVAAVDTYRQLTIEVQGQPVSLVARDLRVHATWSRYLFTAGDSETTLNRTVDEQGVIVSEVLARTLGVSPGSSLVLMTPSGEASFPVLGVFYDYATDGGKVVMDGALYRARWDDDTMTVIPVYLSPGADAGAVRRRVEDTVGPEEHLALISNAEIKAEVLAIFDRTFTVTYALEVIAVVIALLGIINTMLTSVLERQRELATLRAVGASARQIRRLVLWEAGYLGVLGALLGVLGGILLSILLVEVINKQSFGWTIQWTLPITLLVEAVVLAVTVALAAGYFPARWAAHQPVAEGLRYE
ncbi:MAG: ABC transporter permease [Nitrospirae bacterium]|nr:ABC transporter permease [Nitrospirota bacterium]